MNTTENNKLIADFMEMQPRANGLYKKEGKEYSEYTLRFTFDWNWLMEVVEKCLKIALEGDTMEMYFSITDAIPNIRDTHKEVVQFIEWYNSAKEN
jgi:hypothetical protein